MHVFLTGATGFIGKNLIPYLLDRKCHLTCLVRDPQRLPDSLNDKVRMVIGDLHNLGPEVQEMLGSADAIVHLAGQPWGRTYHDFDRVNREGTSRLIEAVEAAGASPNRFIYMSTLAAGGPATPGSPRTEENPDAPMSWYGQTKLAGEKVLADVTFPWTILRPPTVYGPWDQDVRRFFTLVTRRLRPYLVGGFFELSLVHVNDVCQAIWLILSKENLPRSTYYLNDGHPVYQFNDVIAEIVATAQKRCLTLPIPWGLSWFAERSLALGMMIGLRPKRLTADKLREIRRQAWTCSSELISSHLQYRPDFPLRRGFDHTMKWYQSHR